MEIEIQEERVKENLLKLNIHKATGPDDLPPILLRAAADEIAKSLVAIFQTSAKTFALPSLWKVARIAAAYKKDDETDRDNYRPLSMLCITSKVMEKEVYETLVNHIVINPGLLNPNQWAYKKNSSTEALLLHRTEIWRKAVDSNRVVGVVFIDFKKAFDSVPHYQLLLKLQRAGISGNLLLWIKNYLSNRSQFTKIGLCDSEREGVHYGVPQGSVLGPLLFALFCDDLPDCVRHDDEELEMYADDTTLTSIGETVDEVVLQLNETLSLVSEWCNKNGMTVHPGKTEAMLLKRGTFVGPLPPVLLNGSLVRWVKESKSLGVILDNKLKWNGHMENAKLAFARKLSLLKSMDFLPKCMLEDFYWKVIFPSVTYCISVWGNCGKTQFKAMERLHTRAARIVYRLDWDVPSQEVILKSGWKTLSNTYKQRLLSIVHKCCHGEAPDQLCRNIVTKKDSNLRGSGKMVIPRPQTNFLHKSVTFRGSVLWNKLPTNLRNEERYKNFKMLIRQQDLEAMDFSSYTNNNNYLNYIYF